MDIALALRTMVVPTAGAAGASRDSRAAGAAHAPWTVYLQAGAGVVLDSVPASEYEETISKAAALGRAVDLAEDAFVRRGARG